MATIRTFSACGPCITEGTLTGETAKFYCYTDSRGRARKMMKPTPERYSSAHIEPCPSCRDHAQTQYPNGYEN